MNFLGRRNLNGSAGLSRGLRETCGIFRDSRHSALGLRGCGLETRDAQMGDAGSKAFDFRLDDIAHNLGRGGSAKVHEQSMLPARRCIERSLDRRRLAICANRGF
jgi:hypothetical protein